MTTRFSWKADNADTGSRHRSKTISAGMEIKCAPSRSLPNASPNKGILCRLGACNLFNVNIVVSFIPLPEQGSLSVGLGKYFSEYFLVRLPRTCVALDSIFDLETE